MEEDIREIITDLLVWKMKVRKVVGELVAWAGYNGLGLDFANELLDELYEKEGEQS